MLLGRSTSVSARSLCSPFIFGADTAQFKLADAILELVALDQRPIYIIVAQVGTPSLNRVRLQVHQAIIVHVLHIIVELVDDGQRVRHLKSFYVFLADILKCLENSSQCVLVRHYYHTLIIHNFLGDNILPEWENALNAIFHGLDLG